MELNNINHLLEKYFEGDTTVAEEKELKTYFSQNQIAAEHKQYAAMFGYYKTAKTEIFDKNISIEINAKPTKKVNKKWLAVAAVAILFVGTYFGATYWQQKQAEQQQAQMVYNETKKAFDLLAKNLNKGTQKVAYLQQFETAKQKIYNND